MKKHHLLFYRQISRRTRRLLRWLLILGGVLALYDLFNPFLGPNWYFLWVAWPILFALWLYYALLMPRSALQIRPEYLRLQGPLRGFNISYGRIRSITSAQVVQHYPRDKWTGAERRLLAPLRGYTAVFIELNTFPRALRFREWWFPRLFFGTARPGLLLIVDDWLSLSQEVEIARDRWRTRRQERRRGDNRTLAARVLND